MSSPRVRNLLILLALLIGPVTSQAQTREDAAQVRVRLTAGIAATAALVQLIPTIHNEPGEPLPEGTLSGDTVTFAGVAPGTYVIAIGAERRHLALTPRERVVFDAASMQVVDRQSVGEGLHLNARWFTDMASSHNVWSLIETTVPFVIADRMDQGGLGTGRSALLASRGSSWTTTQLTFGGAQVLAPNAHGLIPFALDLSTASAVSVMSGLVPVDYGTPGVVVALTPAAPARRRSGSVALSLTTPGMVGENALPLAPSVMRMDQWAEGSALYATPLDDRTALRLSGSHARIQFQERARPTLWTSRATTFTGHLTRQLRDTSQVRLLGTVQRVAAPYEDRRQFLDRDVREHGTFAQLVSSWQHTLGSGAHLDLRASLQQTHFRPAINSAHGGTLDRVFDGVVPSPAAETSTTQWELGGTLHVPTWSWAGSQHTLRVGGTLMRTALTSTTLASPDVAEMVGGLPARVWRPSPSDGPGRRNVLAGSVFVGDRVAVGDSLTIEAGVRTDLAVGTIRGSADVVRWSTVSPRVMAQWHRGPFAVFAGVGWYSDPLNVSQFRHGDPGETTFRVHRWNDTNGDRLFSADEAGIRVLLAGRGAGIASIDPDLSAPRTLEYTGGVELRLGRHMTLRSAAIWRRQHNILGSVNTGVPSSTYRQRLIPDAGEDWYGPDDDRMVLVYDRDPATFGRDQYLLTNPDDATARYEGIEIVWMWRTRPVEMLFGATAYRIHSWGGQLGFGPLENDHSVIGEVFEQPNARPLLQGRNYFDRAYVGKWAGTVHLPFDMRFGFAARYQDGQPFSRVVVVPDLSTGPEMVHAFQIGRARYTYTLTLDLRLQKTFTVGERTATLHVDVFNATNHKNEVDELALTEPLYRLSTAVQPPVTARVGLRFGW